MIFGCYSEQNNVKAKGGLLDTSGSLNFLIISPLRGMDTGFHVSFIMSLVSLCQIFKFSFLSRRHVFHPSEYYLENLEKLTEASSCLILCPFQQVCRKNAHDVFCLSGSFLGSPLPMFNYFFLLEAESPSAHLALKGPDAISAELKVLPWLSR